MRPRVLTTRIRSASPRRRRTRVTSVVATLAVATATVLQAVVATTPANAVQADPGAGFTVTAGDLSFILKQIKIAERHSATLTASDPCGTLVGPNANQIPDRLTLLRAAHGRRLLQQPLPGPREVRARPTSRSRGYVQPKFRDAEPITAGLPVGPPGPTQLHAEEGQRRRLPAARDQQPDRRPDLHQPGCHRGGPVPGAHPGQQGRGARAPPTPTRPWTRRCWASRPDCVPVAQDPVHPERDHGRRALPAVQLAVHVLRPVLRPRCRPDRQERRAPSSSR